MIGREYKDSHGIWHNIEANDYDDMQEQISSIEKSYNMTRDIGKVYVNAAPTVG